MAHDVAGPAAASNSGAAVRLSNLVSVYTATLVPDQMCDVDGDDDGWHAKLSMFDIQWHAWSTASRQRQRQKPTMERARKGGGGNWIPFQKHEKKSKQASRQAAGDLDVKLPNAAC